jgi:CBS domain-containing protein
MKDQDVGMLPVVDHEGSTRLVGVITDRDITVRHVAAGHRGNACQVREAMTERVATCRFDEDMKDVMRVMADEQVRRIPIVDERNVLIGIVSQADIALRGDSPEATGYILEQISHHLAKSVAD